MIKAENLYKSYDGVKILKGVNIDINPGEITVITGPSGSGKTTLLKNLSLVELPDEGKVTISGIDNQVYAEFPRDAKKHFDSHFPEIGVVFQNLILWPHLTNNENIALSFQREMTKAEKAYKDELVSMFDAKEFLKQYPNQSSLGQCQRVALIRTLVRQPKYLLLDEITASLDIEQCGKLLSFLKKLKEKGVGIVLVTHFLLFAQEAADHVVFMDKGEIVESGDKHILENPRTDRFRSFINGLNNISIKL